MVDVENDHCTAPSRPCSWTTCSAPPVTSSDCNTVKALVSGSVVHGLKVHPTELLGLDGSGDRRCIAWAKGGLHLGIWNDITTKISRRADKSYAPRRSREGHLRRHPRQKKARSSDHLRRVNGSTRHGNNDLFHRRRWPWGFPTTKLSGAVVGGRLRRFRAIIPSRRRPMATPSS